MLLETRVRLIMGERLDRKSGTKFDPGRILSITTESGRIFRGKQFIDATCEGDLMAAAMVRSTIDPELKVLLQMNGHAGCVERFLDKELDDRNPYGIMLVELECLQMIPTYAVNNPNCVNAVQVEVP